MSQPKMTAGLGIVGSQDFIPGARADFDLVGTSQTVVVRETVGVAHTTCCQVLPLQGVYRFKSP
jgi:hypothetical protein